MKLPSPQPRTEIKCRLEDILSSPTAGLDEDDTLKTCDFFLYDLAYQPPYDSMVGSVLYDNELTTFADFMSLANAACIGIQNTRKPLTASLVGRLHHAAGNLLKMMQTNDNAPLGG